MDIRAFRRHVRQALRALGTKATSASHHVHPTYTEEELLRRADEFNQNAERHWQGAVSLPIYPSLSPDELACVCETVQRILS